MQKALNEIKDLRVRGEWQAAHRLIREVQLSAETHPPSSEAELLLQLGITLTEESMFRGVAGLEEGRTALLHAQKLAEGAGDLRLLGRIYNALGFSWHIQFIESDRSKEFAEEIEYFERACTILKEHGSKSEYGLALFNRGLVFDVVRKQYAQAEPFHRQAYELAIEAGDKVLQSYAIRHLGFIHLAAGELESAEKALTESLHLRKAANFIPGTAFSLAALAHLEMRKGNSQRALQLLREARAMLVALDAPARVQWLDKHIATLEES